MKRRGRILSLIADLRFGGAPKRLLSMARTLDGTRFAHQVATCTRLDPDDADGTWLDEYLAAGIEPVDLSEGRGERASADGQPMLAGLALTARVVRSLRRTVRERGIDLLDAHLTGAGLAAAVAGASTGIPVAVTLYHTNPWNRYPKKLAGRFVMRTARAVITDSRARARDLQEWLPAGRRVQVIPNGILPPTSEHGVVRMRRRLGLPEDPRIRIVGQVSRLEPWKGQRVLLEAAREVLAREPDTAFLLVGYAGRPEYPDELRRRAAELGIAERVSVLGYPGPVGDVWRVIDLHVHATMFDSLPIAIKEGMSLAKPAVVTAVVGIPEMVEDGVTGLVVPPEDADALADGIVRLLRDRELAARLGAAARERYEERYRPEVMTRSLEELFARIIGGRNGPEGGSR